MTIFLCILAALSLMTGLKAPRDKAWLLAALYALNVVMTLGLATLAVWTWRQG